MAHCGPLNELPIANHPFYYHYLLVIKPAPAKSIPIILKICKFSFIWKWVFFPNTLFYWNSVNQKKTLFFLIQYFLFTSLKRDIHTKVNLLKKYFLSSVNKYFFFDLSCKDDIAWSLLDKTFWSLSWLRLVQIHDHFLFILGSFIGL